MSELKIMLIKTNKCCFISDCYAKEGSYDYNYHCSNIPNLFFDGEKAENTWSKRWYRIKQYPTKIERLEKAERINERYEIKDVENVTKKLPKSIKREDLENYDENIIDSLYCYAYDQEPDYMVDADVEVETVCELDKFVDFCDFNFKAIGKFNYDTKQYEVKKADIQHQTIDKIIFPEILLSNKPCKLSSKQMYDITRQYIRENIDGKHARITFDYDFCFTVKKIVPKLEPETISYQNVFARTKKERNKIYYKTVESKEIEIFQMTHNQANYKGYTAIGEIFGNTELELKEKINQWLSELIEIINKPLTQCKHCKGTGYSEEIKAAKLIRSEIK